MTTLAEALGATAQGLFEYGLEDLANVGIRLPDEQVHLFEQYVDGGSGYAMTFTPIVNHSNSQPMVFWDTAEEVPLLICYPEVIRLCGDWAEIGNSWNGALAMPSLLGQRLRASPWYGDEEDDLDVHRIWNLWPLEGADVKVVLEDSSEWLEDCEELRMIEEYITVNIGDFDVCDLAENMGCGDASEHEHRDEASPYSRFPIEHCVTGEKVFNELEAEIMVPVHDPDDPDNPWHYPRAFAGPEVASSLAEPWKRLLRASETAALRLPGVVPPWDRTAFIFKERWYTPWLWLS